MDSYEEMIIPEVPKALPNEQLFIYVPIANDDTPGVAKFDNKYFSVDVDGTVRFRSEYMPGMITATGHITIPVAEWTDVMPYDAFLSIPGDSFTNGDLLLLAPEDNATKEACARARISANIDALVDEDPPGMDAVWFLRAESGEIPDSPLHFVYFSIRTGADQDAVAAIIGVDAYGEGCGTGGGVDSAAVEEIVTRLVPGWARREEPPEESDPTVSDWAKASKKPTYNKNEVGLSNVDNVKQYSASNPPPYPVTSVNSKTGAVSLTAGDVGARPASWTPTAADVGADKSGTAASKVTEHNTSTASHTDLRAEIKTLADRLAAVLDSDDTTLDELSEIVAYIKSNKTLIDAITTSKVGVTDIIDDLTTNVANKPLSAAQGVALKTLIDGLQSGKLDAAALTAAKLAQVLGYTPANAANVPTALSQLSGDSTHRTVTDAEKSTWNGKADKAGVASEVTSQLTAAKESGVFDGEDGKSAYAYAKDGGYAGTEAEFAEKLAKDYDALLAQKVAKASLSLGIASDGLIYVFVDGVPVGAGIPQGRSGDVFGYVDANNRIVIKGDLADGNYTVAYEMDDGTTVDIGDLVLGLTYTDLVPTAKGSDGAVLNGVGYQRDARWSTSAGTLATGATGYTAVGFTVMTGGQALTIYVYGLELDGSTNSALITTKALTGTTVNYGYKLTGGFTGTTFVASVEKLANYYYKITTLASGSTAKYFALSGKTVSSMTPVVTLGEPIIAV